MKQQATTIDDIPVVYVAGHKDQPIPEQSKETFHALESQLTSLHGRRFYGVVVGGEYRACVAVTPGERVGDLPHWTIPGGKYVRQQIDDWEDHRDEIGPTCMSLLSRPDRDRTRYLVEFYRSRRELRIMVPVVA